MTFLVAYDRKAENLRSALAPFSRPQPLRTDRQIAQHFHKLAMTYVHDAIERRRWLKKIGNARLFYADLWTKDRALVAKGYRDMARKHRALARELGQ